MAAHRRLVWLRHRHSLLFRCVRCDGFGFSVGLRPSSRKCSAELRWCGSCFGAKTRRACTYSRPGLRFCLAPASDLCCTSTLPEHFFLIFIIDNRAQSYQMPSLNAPRNQIEQRSSADRPRKGACSSSTLIYPINAAAQAESFLHLWDLSKLHSTVSSRHGTTSVFLSTIVGRRHRKLGIGHRFASLLWKHCSEASPGDCLPRPWSMRESKTPITVEDVCQGRQI